MKAISKYSVLIVVIAWAIICFVFFQWFYLYHLAYRLQVQLFLYTSDYLSSYFHYPAWFSCLSGDFLTQFFYYNYAGALTITLTLLFLGGTFYLALGKLDFNLFSQSKHKKKLQVWFKVLLSLALISWETLRNCGLNYELSSTVSLIGGMLLFLLYNVFKQRWRWASGVLLIPLCYWLFGYGLIAFVVLSLLSEMKSHNYFLALLLPMVALSMPALLRQSYHLTWKQAYRYPSETFFNTPNFTIEKILAMDAESSFGHWNRVVQLSEKEDLKSSTSTYYFNLSHAMQERLPQVLMNEYQPGPLGLLISLNPSTAFLSLWGSNEVWFQLGDMTMAEHSALLGMIFSPHHRSARMVMRLAEINMVKGDAEAAIKYLRLLRKTWLYKEWADDRMPGKETDRVKGWLQQRRALLPVQDMLRNAYDQTNSLRVLLNSYPANAMALDYLLCYDLLSKDLKRFMIDYNQYKLPDKEMPNRLYSEALLIKLTQDQATMEDVKRYRILPDVYNEFNEYTSQFEANNGNGQNLQPRYGKTYWFYYHFATFRKS